MRQLNLFLVFIASSLVFLAGTNPAASAEVTPGLDVKIGQMVMVGFRGLAVSDEGPVARDIRVRHIGGVILFDYDVPTRTYGRNIASAKQTKALTSSLQRQASIPLFIAIDQEGGRISRLKEKNGFPPTVSQKQLGMWDDLKKTGSQADITAKTLAGLGINVNFVPVVDLDINPENPVIGKLERSFSPDTAVVTRHALAVIEAHRRYGVLTAPKHFPGHGSAAGDTHEGLVDVTTRWTALELEPFRSLIRQQKADMIMTAHIFNGKLDPVWPATLSPGTLTGLLRQEMGFDGVVISDDMQMKAIASRYGLETAIGQAILAGVDVLLFANNSVYEEDIAARAITTIRALVEKGDIPRERIDASYRRIMKLKERLRRQ
jgi:beta-N-acetylhexosaminidase